MTATKTAADYLAEAENKHRQGEACLTAADKILNDTSRKWGAETFVAAVDTKYAQAAALFAGATSAASIAQLIVAAHMAGEPR